MNGVALDSTGRYMSANIFVRRYSNRVRISVPNCDELMTLVTWVFCESRTMDDPTAPGGRVTADAIKFFVLRGLNFEHRDSHGLIGNYNYTCVIIIMLIIYLMLISLGRSSLYALFTKTTCTVRNFEFPHVL